MREIKFRAWNPDSKKMTYVPNDGGYLHLGHKSGFISPLNWYVCNDKESTAYSDRSFLMQFTGLLDKNGKEIYEGDIITPGKREVLFGEYFGSFGMGTGFYTIARAHETDLYEANPFGITTRQIDESEIIGNIYENPELSTVAYANAK